MAKAKEVPKRAYRTMLSASMMQSVCSTMRCKKITTIRKILSNLKGESLAL
jgi:hypothetical protein